MLFFSHQHARAVIDGRWKVLWSKRSPEPLSWELYDLEADPCETTDLADQYPERVKEMAAQWEAYRQRVGLEEFEPWHIPEIEGIAD
jgi:arylsulfatase